MTTTAGVLVLLTVTAAPARPSAEADVRAGAGPDQVVIGRYRLRQQKSGDYLCETEAFVARVREDGRVDFSERPRLPGPATWPIVAAVRAVGAATAGKNLGSAVTDEARNPALTVGNDDLQRDRHHAQKMAFLADTARFREGLRRSHDRAALVAWQRNLDALAGNRRLPAGERRQALFELWLECEDSPGGADARAAVEEAIRKHFPPRSPDAYTPAELQRLNTRTTPELRFHPYR
jgi:hypothetical protein